MKVSEALKGQFKKIHSESLDMEEGGITLKKTL